jgi:transposase
MRYELADDEWIAIKPMLPNKPRGVPRVSDRRVLNGIFWVLRSGAAWRELPEMFGPNTTCYNRFVRWRRAGVWGPHHRHTCCCPRCPCPNDRHLHCPRASRNRCQSMGRSRGGLTSKIHAVVCRYGWR